MATKKIIAHYMHETELAAATRIVQPVETTESFLMADASDDEIARLRKEGVVVQVLGEAEARKPLRTLTRSVGAVAEAVIDEKKPNYYRIETGGPLFPSWRQQLEGEGVKILEYVPPSAYAARLDPGQAHNVAKLPFVTSVKLFGLEEPVALPPRTRGDIPSPFGTLSEKRFDLRIDDRKNRFETVEWLQRNGVRVEDDFGRRVRVVITDDAASRDKLKSAPHVVSVDEYRATYDIRLHVEEGRKVVVEWLEKRQIPIKGVAARKIRAEFGDKADLVEELAEVPEVAAVDEWIAPDVRNDVARALLGIDRNGGPPLTLTGAGQVVGVADTGIDANHPDFATRIATVIARGRPNDASDPDGHGTHVAGSVLGDGAGSGGAIRGAAPKAKLVFQSVLDANDELGGLPLDLGELFEEAYQAGARVHNNSWGAATRGRYTGTAVDVDEFVVKRPDMLIVIAAGNEGTESPRVHSKQGFVDWLSIGSPASAKNALTVGASRSSRTSGGFAANTYGQVWPGDFANVPIRNEKVSGDPNALAAFSSRGPCDDYRIKPDVVAPGTDILSTKSSQAPNQNFWGVFPGHNQRYAYMGGTSMATPIVAGCAALVREYYVSKRNHTPSAALLKATLINGARQLTGADAIADHGFTPNYHQGFGCIDMTRTVPDPSLPVQFELAFVDASAATRLNTMGSRKRFEIDVTKQGRLRVTLAWTDPTGRSVQNSLALQVQHIPTGTKWMGNPKVPQSLTTPDPTNNVVVVRLDDAKPGKYLIQVSAYNLAKPPQEFSLVATGDIGATLKAVP